MVGSPPEVGGPLMVVGPPEVGGPLMMVDPPEVGGPLMDRAVRGLVGAGWLPPSTNSFRLGALNMPHTLPQPELELQLLPPPTAAVPLDCDVCPFVAWAVLDDVTTPPVIHHQTLHSLHSFSFSCFGPLPHLPHFPPTIDPETLAACSRSLY